MIKWRGVKIDIHEDFLEYCDETLLHCETLTEEAEVTYHAGYYTIVFWDINEREEDWIDYLDINDVKQFLEKYFNG